MNPLKLPIFALIFALTACSVKAPAPDLNSPPISSATTSEVDPANEEQVEITATVVPTAASELRGDIAPIQVTPSPTAVAQPSPAMTVVPPKSAVAAELSASVPPERDDLRLAIAYRGLPDSHVEDDPLTTESLRPGTQQTFTILNVVDKTVGEIEAELRIVSDHAYFWFDNGPGSVSPDQNELARVSQTFDEVYLDVVSHFGSERNPGIDGDPRLHIVHASPIALCGVTEETVDQCYLSGLVNSTDLLPVELDPRSNEREMFVMNARIFGSDYYMGVLAHEFRHMIEDNYDKSDKDWEVEGSAILAAQMAGFPSSGIERGNMFLEQPDQQLNSWVDAGTGPYYGQGYLLNRYIYDQLGEVLYHEFATSPLSGLAALDGVAVTNGLDFDGHTLWLDYLVALAIHDDPQAPAQFQFESTDLNSAAMTSVSHLPASYQEQVSQYAADYYELPSGAQSITFSGAEEVSLLGVEPVSGDRYWYAQRENYSNPRLTFSVDLGELDQATLQYDAYVDIEQGYDFAYVSVSLDDGRTWIALEGDNMQGLDPADNPAGSALADRFYTGRNRRWTNESIDISEYAGEQILLRFEYVTDPILTYGGLALDNITVPELGFVDGAEGEVGEFLAEGFTRATAAIPQSWHIQHITYTEEGPEVNKLEVDPAGSLFMLLNSDMHQTSTLIIAATAPSTLEKAAYELDVD